MPGAYAFDGVDDLISYPHLSETDGASRLTISAWIYPISGGGYKYLLGGIGNNGGGAGASAGFGVQQYSGIDTLYLAFRGSGTERGKANAFTAEAWNHLWIVYDGTQAAASRLRAWVNGSQITSFDVNGADEPTSLNTHDQPFTLAYGEGWSGSYSQCRLADIGILFGRAVTDGSTISAVAGGSSVGHYVQTGDFWASFRVNGNDENGGRAATISGATLVDGPSLTYPSGGGGTGNPWYYFAQVA